MNAYKNNYQKIAMFVIALFLAQANCFATNIFTYYKSDFLSEDQMRYAKSWTSQSWAQEYWYVSIPKGITETQILQLNMPNNEIINITQDHVQKIDESILYWFGNYNGGGSANLVNHEGMITARVSDLRNTYLIYPISGGMHILIKCDMSMMLNDESPSGYKNMIEEGLKYKVEELRKENKINDKEDNIQLQGDCRVRVLVIFTDDVYNTLADVIGFTHSCIATSNMTYTNSAMTFQLELAFSKKQVYNETGDATIDLARFKSTNDGFMDGIHFYRNDYDADICVLLVENLNDCGLAAVVANSSFADAFCVVARSCATSNLSFPHEIGHLYGCRHDTYVDNNNTPYSYGHGYINLPAQWRTVMAYKDQCTVNNTSCTRIPYFSNPSINYLNAPTGTVATNNNAWASENSRINISTLQTADFNKLLGTEIFFDDDYFDGFAANSISNNGNFTLNSGASGLMRAGTEVILNPGFLAYEGSTFNAILDWCAPLRNSNISQVNSAFENSLISIYPNPASTLLSIIIPNISVPIQFKIFSTTTQLIKTIKVDSGAETTISVSDLPSGIYFIDAQSDNQHWRQKFIINR